MIRIFARGSPGVCHSGIGRRLLQRVDALLDEDPHQRAAQALPHRPTLERCGRRDVLAVPLGDDPPFVGDDERRRHPGGIEGRVHRLPHFGHVHVRGRAARGSRSPIGQGCVFGSGRALFTIEGLKNTSVLPIGSVMHPWLPTCFATRTVPLGIVTSTVRFSRSIFGVPSLARSAYGAVK